MPAKDPKTYSAHHYLKNKDKYRESSKNSRERKREWYEEIMKDKQCTKCGESDIACLDWHHLNPSQKEETISFMLSNRGKQTILEEMKKCVCLCSNCHRKLHYYGH